MSKITTLDKVATDKLITSIKGRGAKLDNDIHAAGMGALAHHHAHGDTTLVNRLILAMPKSGRKNALVAWMLANNDRLALNTDKASREVQPLVHVKGEASKGFNMEQAEVTPFWDFKAKEGGSVMTFDTYMASLSKGLDKALKMADLTEEQAAKLQALKVALA